MGILDELRNDVEGIRLLSDWIGDGGEPVTQMRAEHRAYACTHGDDGYPCEFNIEPNWWERHIKEPIAETIRGELELKQRLHLKVSGEETLGMCRHCGCCLRLKIWTPIKHVKKHTTAEMLAKYPSWCWQKKEIEGS